MTNQSYHTKFIREYKESVNTNHALKDYDIRCNYKAITFFDMFALW